MLNRTFEVEVEEVSVEESAGRYTVRWVTGSARWEESFASLARARSFEAELRAAVSREQPFYLANGRPVAWGRPAADRSWYDFCVSYVDMKWKDASASSRAARAHVLTRIMLVMIGEGISVPYDGSEIRQALRQWGFNTRRRPDCPPRVGEILAWLSASTRPVSALNSPEVLRAALDAACRTLSGKRAARSTAHNGRGVLSNALDYAVEQDLLDSNPIRSLKLKAPKVVAVVDARRVVNPDQAERLLDAVASVRPSGPRLVAYFAVLYYAGLRPSEAAALRAENILLPPLVWNEAAGCWQEPDPGRGELRINGGAPGVRRSWTDDGASREDRPLKGQAEGDWRRVPVPPALTRLLRAHLEQFPPSPRGRIFSGLRGGELTPEICCLVWDRARKIALTPAEYDSPLARRPYDLRHACLSTWLAGEVAPVQVAEWAGHSVEVLLSVYAQCLAGQDLIALQRIEEALRWTGETAGNPLTRPPQPPQRRKAPEHPLPDV